MAKRERVTSQTGNQPPSHRTRRAEDKSAETKRRAKILGDIIRYWRDKNRLSQHDLADLLGLTAGAVGQWETGANSPSMATIVRLPSVLRGLTMDALLFALPASERGVAQIETERQLLEWARKRPIAASVAAITVMETWSQQSSQNPEDAGAIMEAYFQLPPDAQKQAREIMSVLSKAARPKIEKPPVDAGLTEHSREDERPDNAQAKGKSPAAVTANRPKGNAAPAKRSGPKPSRPKTRKTRSVVAEAMS